MIDISNVVKNADYLGSGPKYATDGKIGVAKTDGSGDFMLDEPGGLRNIISFEAFVLALVIQISSFLSFIYRVTSHDEILIVCIKK